MRNEGAFQKRRIEAKDCSLRKWDIGYLDAKVPWPGRGRLRLGRSVVTAPEGVWTGVIGLPGEDYTAGYKVRGKMKR